jgi:hypothetical protein
MVVRIRQTCLNAEPTQERVEKNELFGAAPRDHLGLDVLWCRFGTDVRGSGGVARVVLGVGFGGPILFVLDF